MYFKRHVLRVVGETETMQENNQDWLELMKETLDFSLAFHSF
jgi:hypothetical protein